MGAGPAHPRETTPRTFTDFHGPSWTGLPCPWCSCSPLGPSFPCFEMSLLRNVGRGLAPARVGGGSLGKVESKAECRNLPARPAFPPTPREPSRPWPLRVWDRSSRLEELSDYSTTSSTGQPMTSTPGGSLTPPRKTEPASSARSRRPSKPTERFESGNGGMSRVSICESKARPSSASRSLLVLLNSRRLRSSPGPRFGSTASRIWSQARW